MTKNLIIPALMGMAALVSSCGKSEVENTYTQQDKNIESLVKSLAPEESEATVDYLDGVVRVTVKHGEGAALESGGQSGAINNSLGDWETKRSSTMSGRRCSI